MLGQLRPLLRRQRRRGARQAMHRVHHGFTPCARLQIELLAVEIRLRVDCDPGQHLRIRLFLHRQVFSGAARDTGIPAFERQPYARPYVVFGELVVLAQRSEKRRTALGLIAAAEPQRARIVQRFRAAAAQAALQRITKEFGIVTDDLRIFRIEQIPLLLAGEQLQPVGAQAVRHRAVLQARQQRLHLGGRGFVQAQTQAPVCNIGFERVIAQGFRVALELDHIADLERFAGGEKIVILGAMHHARARA